MDAIKQSIAQNTGIGGAHEQVPEDQRFDLNDTPDLKGKVAVVTGGSEGIGFGAVYTMLKHNLEKVFILSVSKEVMDESLKKISEDLGEETAKKVTWYECDLSDWKKVKQTADEIAKNTDRIDILINNAGRGIMTYQLTDYNVDRHVSPSTPLLLPKEHTDPLPLSQMAMNHMAHVILTSHLLPILKKTASSSNTVRICNMGSNAHQGAPSDTKFASLDELNQDLGPNGQYGRSKLAVMLHARYLNTHLTSSHPNILANSMHPGFVETKMSVKDIHEPYPVIGYAMSVGMSPLKKDIWQGCVSTVFAATKTTKSGQYICPPAVPESGTDLAQNDELAESLMKLTREVVKEKTYEDSAAKGCPFTDY